MPSSAIAMSCSLMLALTMLCGAWGQDAGSRIVVVGQDGTGDFNGRDEKPIIAALASLGEDGGTVLLKPGEYLIRAGIELQSNAVIRGSAGTILRLPHPVLTTARAAAGEMALRVADTSEFAPDTEIQLCPPVGAETFPESEDKTLKATVSAVEDVQLVLTEPLPCPIPEGSRLGYAHSVFRIAGPTRNVVIENLTIDGGRRADIPMPGHVERCAIRAHGRYTYEDGPLGPPAELVRVINCHIRNCYGRAVAWYSVVRSEVRGCLIEGIADEAIDFDHFCYHCQAVGNEVRDAVTGVTINDGSYCTVEYNRFTNCGVGVTIWWWYKCPQTDIDVENVIRHNFVFAPERAGIHVGKRCFRNRIVGNFVEGEIDVAEPDNVVDSNTIIGRPGD